MSARTLLSIALLAGVAAMPATNHWTHFVSPQCRFSTWYPPGWRQTVPASEGLEIANFPKSQAVTGVFIPITGALIQAGPAADQSQTMEDDVIGQMRADWARLTTLDQTIVTGMPYPNFPKTLRVVEYYENYGTATKPILQHTTMILCKVHGRIFIVELFYWRGNRHAKMLEGEALDVARDLDIEK